MSGLSLETVVVIGAIVATGSGAATAAQGVARATAGDSALPSPLTHSLTYEEFAALTPQQRFERFATLEDEDKAVLLRQHVDHWLRQNRRRLSDSQIAVVEELGALLYERFANTKSINDPEFNRRVEALEKSADCRLRQSDFSAVLGPMVPPSPEVPGWRDGMWAWLEHCVAPAVLK